MSITAGNLPSSTFISLPSSVLTTSGSSSSSALPGITSSPTTPDAVVTSLGTESSTTEGSLTMLSVLEQSSQPVKTSLPPTWNTRTTKSADLGRVTSGFPAPLLSTLLIKTEDSVERNTKIPNEAAHGGIAGSIAGPLATTLPARSNGPSTGGTGKAETTTTALKTTSMPTLITWVSIPTSEVLSLQISEDTASTASFSDKYSNSSSFFF
ncbi:mucin-16-like [Sciurus carolinensis]|uniref:mucin-16-like n=1 Tax=Sciurus carolinensis TaxID=30640 RepID=UPI001FB21E54|nr:mucin-16-like [Sciurus carolinensis]